MSAITLYDFALDDNCYKVRVLLSALGLDYTTAEVDVFPGAEQRSEKMLALNPRGAIPVLTDGDLVLHEAEPILAYLAHRYDAARTWLPDDPALFGAVMMWLAFAGHDLNAASVARLNAMMEVPADVPAVLDAAKMALRIMEDHMTAREFDGKHWFVGEAATLADIALFPGFALSRDSGIEHDAYPALRRWGRRVRTIPGFKTMPGIPDYH